MITKVLYVVALVIVGGVSYYAGTQTWYITDDNRLIHYNTRDMWRYELSCSSALLDGMHVLYEQDKGFWHSEFVHTPEFEKIDDLEMVEWADFYGYDAAIMLGPAE